MPMLALNPLARSSADMRRDELRRYGNRLWYHPVRRHVPNGRALTFVGEEMVLYSEIVQAFHGASFDRSLADQLNPEAREFTIAYSPIEPRVRAAELEAAASRIPGLRLIETEPVEHPVGEIDNFWAFRPVIDQFLEKCARSSAGPLSAGRARAAVKR